MFLCPPPSAILVYQALEQCPEALRELIICLQDDWVPSITGHRYSGMSLGPETFQTQKNMHGFILLPWSSDFYQVSKNPLVPRSFPFWTLPPLLLLCPNDSSLSNLSQGLLSVIDNIWYGLLTVLSCPDRPLALYELATGMLLLSHYFGLAFKSWLVYSNKPHLSLRNDLKKQLNFSKPPFLLSYDGNKSQLG